MELDANILQNWSYHATVKILLKKFQDQDHDPHQHRNRTVQSVAVVGYTSHRFGGKENIMQLDNETV